jgi:glycosyltransferase involved in cell wall biosynthesis
MVVPEAMAAGCAVLAMDAGGPREVITHGVDGLLVPPGDPLALGAAISAVCADDALRARLAAAGRRTARTRSSVEACARELTAVYDLALAASRGERGGAGPGARAGRAG